MIASRASRTTRGVALRRLAAAARDGLRRIPQPNGAVLDEPTAGIDPVARRGCGICSSSFPSRGITLFVTTHCMDEAELLARRLHLSPPSSSCAAKPDGSKQLPAWTPPAHAAGCDVRPRHGRPAGSAQTSRRARRHDLRPIHAPAAGRKSDGDQNRLAEVKIQTADIRPIAPSLEDVFVTLTAEQEEKP